MCKWVEGGLDGHGHGASLPVNVFGLTDIEYALKSWNYLQGCASYFCVAGWIPDAGGDGRYLLQRIYAVRWNRCVGR